MSQSPGYMAAYNDRRRFGGNKQQAIVASSGRCVCCGDAAVLVHHRDGNRANNDPKNLLALCRSCHAWMHTSERNYTLSAEERRKMADHARRFISPEIARLRSKKREANKRRRAGQPETLTRTCALCGEAFTRPNISRYRTVRYCSLRCARKGAWNARKAV